MQHPSTPKPAKIRQGQTPTKPETATGKPKKARKLFTKAEDAEILRGADKYQNGWQMIIDNSTLLTENGRCARSVQARYTLLQNKEFERSHDDVAETAVNRDQIASNLVSGEEARKIFQHRNKLQTRYLFNSEEADYSETDKQQEVQSYLADRKRDRLEEMSARKRKKQKTDGKDDDEKELCEAEDEEQEEKEGKEKEREDKEKEVEGKEKEKETTYSSASAPKEAEVAKFRAHHEKQSTKRGRAKAAEKKKENEEMLLTWLELTKKQSAADEERREAAERKREERIIAMMEKQQQQSLAMGQALLDMAQRFVQRDDEEEEKRKEKRGAS